MHYGPSGPRLAGHHEGRQPCDLDGRAALPPFFR